MEEEVTRDAFLGGRVHLYQPKTGYRAGVDPVLLAAFVRAKSGQRVLDLGCGAGAAALCLAARVPGLALTGVERQARYAELARRNAKANGAALRVVEADLTALPSDLRQERFDHVLANPPYYLPAAGTQAQEPSRAAALAEETPLAEWVRIAAKRLAPKGYAHFILKAPRLPDLLAACSGRLGSLEVVPLLPRAGRAAELVLLRGRAGGRAAFQLHAPVTLHQGVAHGADAEDYDARIAAVLRNGAALTI